MPGTYEPIATHTIPSATASYTFSSIPATYTDLILIMNGKATGTANALIRFNGDTGSNYSYTFLTGDGSSPTTGRASSVTSILLNYYGYFETGYTTNMIVQIQNYTNTTTYKTILSRANNAVNGTAAIIGLWRATPAAINSMTIITGSNLFDVGTTFTLYGIKAA
jgi:hypothetical protein